MEELKVLKATSLRLQSNASGTNNTMFIVVTNVNLFLKEIPPTHPCSWVNKLSFNTAGELEDEKGTKLTICGWHSRSNSDITSQNEMEKCWIYHPTEKSIWVNGAQCYDQCWIQEKEFLLKRNKIDEKFQKYYHSLDEWLNPAYKTVEIFQENLKQLEYLRTTKEDLEKEATVLDTEMDYNDPSYRLLNEMVTNRKEELRVNTKNAQDFYRKAQKEKEKDGIAYVPTSREYTEDQYINVRTSDLKDKLKVAEKNLEAWINRKRLVVENSQKRIRELQRISNEYQLSKKKIKLYI